MPELISKYGLNWDPWLTPLEIEFRMIQAGGIVEANGKKFGEGLFQHFRNAQTIRWPEEDHHSWSDLILKTILEERLTVVQGSRDSSKTRTFVKWALIDYWCFPNETLFLISSTDVRGLELRVWGDIKDLWDRDRDKFDWLQGNPVDSKHGIFTDALDDTGDIRDMRKGIICVPVLDSEGNETKLLEKFVGVKQKRRRVICDEAQFLPARYLSILANVDKGDFKSGFTGNPLGQKALDRVAEPEVGWANFPEPSKTSTWRNKFDGVTINLVGTDSPNFDPKRPKNYPYLINEDDVKRVEKRFGPDSVEFYSQIKGVRKSGLNPRLVLTPEMCKVNGAYDECRWGHQDLTNVLGIDAGFGGDACETILIQFGTGSMGQPLIKFHEPEVIPINLNDPDTPEDQIAKGAKKKCQKLNVPFSNVFFEAGMRATLAISLARILGNEVNAVNAGGPATERPVSSDLFVDDEVRFGSKRLKRCDEHYSKFITEAWFSVRLLVECRQAREMPQSVVKEFSEREWIWARGNRYELETKEDFKLRCHYSPNKADATAIAVEGARRLGFEIARIPIDNTDDASHDWLAAEIAKEKKFRKELTFR